MLIGSSKMFAVLIGLLAASSSDVLAGHPPGFPLPSANRSQPDSSAILGFPSLYQSHLIKECPDPSTQCVGQFAAVPNNRLLQATNINCLGSAANNPEATFALITGPITSPNVFDAFVVFSGDQFHYSINETILSFFEAAVRPKMLLGVGHGAGLGLVCTLTGMLLTPP